MEILGRFVVFDVPRPYQQDSLPFLLFRLFPPFIRPSFSLPIPANRRSLRNRCQKKQDIWNTTCYPKAADHVNTEKTWNVVDAVDKVPGRLASTISIYIRGKDLPTYTPSINTGSFVTVEAFGKTRGMKVKTFDQLQQRITERIIEHAVRGMLPKGRLGRALFNHLKVYKGANQPHEAQKPIDLPIRDKRIQIQR